MPVFTQPRSAARDPRVVCLMYVCAAMLLSFLPALAGESSAPSLSTSLVSDPTLPVSQKGVKFIGPEVLEPRPGEITVEGVVQSVDPANKRLSVLVASILIPGKDWVILDPAQPKTISYAATSTLPPLSSTDDGAPDLPLTEIQPGVHVTAVGSDLGVGKLLPARAIEAIVHPALKEVYLDSLGLGAMDSGWATPYANRSIDGHGLKVAGREYRRGVGTHAISRVTVHLGSQCERFRAEVGVDDETNGKGSVEFALVSGSRLLGRSGIMRWGMKQDIDLDVHGLDSVTLLVGDTGDGGDSDHADWCNARFISSDPHFSPYTTYSTPPDRTGYLYPANTEGERLDGPIVTIPLLFIELTDDDGTEREVFSRNMISGILLVMNHAYANAGVHFTCNPDTDYREIHSTLLNRDFDPTSGMFTDPGQRPPEANSAAHSAARDKLAWNYPFHVPIVCRRGSEWQFDHAAGRWLDKPSPGNYGGGYIFSVALGVDPKDFCHEMGHSLGLPHTFGPRPETIAVAAAIIRKTVEQGLPKERGLEALDGDLPWISDTPADISDTAVFHDRKVWKEWPVAAIPVTFADGTQLTYRLQPDPFNIMSYFPEWRDQHPQNHSRMGHFTTGQLTIIRRKAIQRFDDRGRIPDQTIAPLGKRYEFADAPRSGSSRPCTLQQLSDTFGPPDSSDWMRGRQVLWKLSEGDTVRFQFPAVPEGRYRVWWAGSFSSDYGTFALAVNGNKLRRFDAFLPGWAPTGWRNMGECRLSGKVQVEFSMLRSNPLSKGSNLGTASIVFEPGETN